MPIIIDINEINVKIPFSTVDKQKNPIYGATKPFFGFLYFLKCCM